MKCVMVGYAPDHTEDMYRLYNMETGKIIQSRDVRWAEWEKTRPKDGVSIFEKQPKLIKQESCIKESEEYEVVDLDEEDSKPNENCQQETRKKIRKKFRNHKPSEREWKFEP